ncbi:MAG: hypothetical protein AAGF31_09400 [Planctomycetota bacterium]
MTPHVVKISGSLLSLPDPYERIKNAIRRLRYAETDSHLVLIVGGGEAVEQIREQDRQHSLGEEAAHWAAIEQMDANTRSIASHLPDAVVCSSWKTLKTRCRDSGQTLFATGDFLKAIEPQLPGTRLPIGWQVTSDSIAARVAILLGAPLTLVKARPFPTPMSQQGWREYARQGIVDEFLPSLVGELSSITLTGPDG